MSAMARALKRSMLAVILIALVAVLMPTVHADAATAKLVMTASTMTPTAGEPFSLTVTAVDENGNVAPTYTGTVHFATNDTSPGAVMPPDSQLTNGEGTFSATLDQAGPQTVTATDTATPTITG